ncbi:MAG TPA: redoxin domain-containing protein [Planctomycetota bacterium]|nr:redoxin domain-containing protein [Planctomycetota bacterium]
MPIRFFAALTLCAAFAIAASAAAEVGKPAPAFTGTDVDGKAVSLADFAGKTVVLEWMNPECPFSGPRRFESGAAQKQAAALKEQGVQVVLISSSSHLDAAALKAYATKQKITTPIVVDQSGEIGKAYGAKTTPHCFVIGGDGNVVYAGAIDDDKEGAKGDKAVNYVDQAVKEHAAGGKLTQASTQPYGCSVKYAK